MEWRARMVARARRCGAYCHASLSLVAAVTTCFVWRWQKMGHTLTLDIPDEVYVSLLQQAQQAGKTPKKQYLPG